MTARRIDIVVVYKINRLTRSLADFAVKAQQAACAINLQIGATVLLGSYHFGRPQGVYWTPSPIFLHAESCERFEQANIVPEIVRQRLVSVRAYGPDDMWIYELGDVCDGRCRAASRSRSG